MVANLPRAIVTRDLSAARHDPFGRKPLDQFIGKRIVRARVAQHLTRQELAWRLNLPVDCLAAFETGKRRVPPGALLDIAAVLRRRISFFFQGGERAAAPRLPAPAAARFGYEAQGEFGH